jgi:hypothetical protein
VPGARVREALAEVEPSRRLILASIKSIVPILPFLSS